MSTALAHKVTSYDALLALPEHLIGEIVAGELHVSPRPAPPHADASSGLMAEIRSPFGRGRGGPGGWQILFEPELHLDQDVLVPDLAGWRRERLPVLPETAYFTLAPDWICEVLSPSTSRLDRSIKMAIYARQGVQHLWLVDPLARTLEVYRNAQGQGLWLLCQVFADKGLVAAEPFDAVPLDLSALWPPEPEPAPGGS